MTTNKYGNALTILLVILIIAIIVGVGFLVYNYVIKPNMEEKNAIEAIEEFDRQVGDNGNEEDSHSEQIEAPKEDSSTGSGKHKVYYKEFVMLGYITIPKTNVKQPILDTVTPESLNTAVAVLYPSNPQLNQPGNVVIVGHNYRNGQFFSDNKKLSVGDKILIKDNSGTQLSYKIYQKFETTEQDTSFYTRDTKGVAEITLSTCTDDAKSRIIILAKAE